MDRGAWSLWATVHRVTKSWTGLKQLSVHLSDGESQHSDLGSLPPEPFPLAFMLSGH